MLFEGRKRDAAANALLAISFAANAAQSPKDFVKSGYAAAPGVQLMDRMMQKRKEANRNLDSSRVSHPARNKTFKEFVEVYSLLEKTFSSREDAIKYHQENPPFNGEPYHIRRKSRSGESPRWRPVRAGKRNEQGKIRKSREKELTQTDFEVHANRTLRKNPKELAAIAADRERDSLSKQKKAAKRVKGVIDHSQPLSQRKRNPKNRERFERITPGGASTNLQVTSSSKNLRKSDNPPKRGQRGYGTTKSGAIKKRLDKAQKFSDKLDKLIDIVRNESCTKNIKSFPVLESSTTQKLIHRSAELIK